MRKLLKYQCSGVITVFFALALPVFLGLFFALVESVRVQGARAQAANNMDMANYSLFSEFEKQLLTDYEIFGLDGGYGGGSFSLSQVNEHLKKYLGWNERPAADGLSGLCFDPWQIRLKDSAVRKVALLTDPGGCGFYQQAVSYMKETAAAALAGKLYEHYSDAQKMEGLQEEYEAAKEISDSEMANAEADESAILEEAEKNGVRLERPKGITDPLKELARVISRGIWKNVMGDTDVSGRSVAGYSLASHRLLLTGTLKIPEKNGGLSDDLLFREYLLDHFPNYLEEGSAENGEDQNALQYQAEYLIAGKRKDQQNLKEVVVKLVLLREGVNYLYCVQDMGMNSEAEGLALLLAGWTGIPQLVEAVKHALLLGWAYGESLIDVRTLMQGGRIPLMKDPQSWYLSLDQLGRLSSVLAEGGKDRGEGLAYRDYLRLLLNMQGISVQEKRGIDLLEMNLRCRCGFPAFRADHCVVAVKDEAEWTIRPVFFRVTSAFTGVSGSIWEVRTEAGFSYQ